MVISRRNRNAIYIQVKYLGIFFKFDGESNIELYCRIGQVGSVLKRLVRSIIRKAKLGVEAWCVPYPTSSLVDHASQKIMLIQSLFDCRSTKYE